MTLTNMDAARKTALDTINAALAQTGLSANALAARAKVAPSTLTRFLRDPEKAKHVPTTKTLAKVRKAAQGSSDELVIDAPPAEAGRSAIPLDAELWRQILIEGFRYGVEGMSGEEFATKAFRAYEYLIKARDRERELFSEVWKGAARK